MISVSTQRRPANPMSFPQLFNWATKLVLRFELLRFKLDLKVCMCVSSFCFEITSHKGNATPITAQASLWGWWSADHVGEGQHFFGCLVYWGRLCYGGPRSDQRSSPTQESLLYFGESTSFHIIVWQSSFNIVMVCQFHFKSFLLKHFIFKFLLSQMQVCIYTGL